MCITTIKEKGDELRESWKAFTRECLGERKEKGETL